MTDKKITQLDELTEVASSDAMVIIDDPSGTPITKKTTVDKIMGASGITSDMHTAGYLTSKKSGVFATLNAETGTTITTAGTWYPIQGVFTNNPMEDFSFDTDHITYDGTKTQFFIIQWHASVTGDSNGITVSIAVKKNSTVIESAKMCSFLKTADEKYQNSGVCVCELETDDELQLVVTADDNGDVISFCNFVTCISEFFD